MTYHKEGMVGTSTDDPDLDTVLGIPLKPVSHMKMQSEHRTHASETIKHIDVVARVQIVNGTLAVDLKGV